MIYSWKARNLDGMIYEGKVEAASKQEAAALLKRKYAYIIQLEEIQQYFLLTSIFSTQGRFTDKQRILFFKQLAVILNSGISLLQGIELLQYRLPKNVAQICIQLKNALCNGSSLSNALAQYPQFFPSLVIILVSAGELSGRLNDILVEITSYYENQATMKAFLYKSAIYPIFIVCISVLVLAFFLFFVLPVLGNTYLSMHVQPNTFMRLVLFLNIFVKQNFIYLLLTLAAGCISCFYYKKQLIHILFKVPLVNDVYGYFTEIRFCKLLSLLLGSGLNIIEAVQEAGKVFMTPKQKQAIYYFTKSLQQGTDIAACAKRAKNIFSPLTIEFISVGAVTGNLPKMLNDAADLLNQDLKDKLEEFKEIFAPVLLLIAAFVTAVIICTVMEPLFDLFSALPE